jgi:hypothetical protein
MSNQLELNIREKVSKETLAAEDPFSLDLKFPVEEVAFQYGTISLRNIENGIWLWGIKYSIPQRGAGGGFYPLRVHGPDFATFSRQEAIDAALPWFKNRFEMDSVKLR